MLKLAMEIPTSKLKDWSRLTDLDFVLAHKVLSDAEYAQFFLNRRLGRDLILDNSTHEFGAPLPLEQLKKAAELCNADYLIAPDIVNPTIDEMQVHRNRKWMRQTAQLKTEVDIAAVLCGNTPEERAEYIHEAYDYGVSMLCFTFHMPNRLEWWDEFVNHETFDDWRVIHLLGVDSLKELWKWRRISDEHTHLEFSVDTSKALKFGVQNQLIDQVPNLRGGTVRSKEVLELSEFTPQQEECVLHNIQVLRYICGG